AGAVTLNRGVLTDGGNICIGGSTNCAAAAGAPRVSSVTANADLQAGSSAASTGVVDIYSTGAISLQAVRVGQAAANTIDSAQGGVTVNTALGGISSTGASPGVGAITVKAGGDVQFAGANSNSTVAIEAFGNLTTGFNSNTARTLIAANGITLDAGKTLTVDAVSGAASLLAGVSLDGVTVSNANAEV